ncbi:MAG: M60 family metallopeptidase, partial [Lachnospiraceae bacterium]|nr:M60 family metallopeptidase [Lachnospiraceae bacterium]
AFMYASGNHIGIEWGSSNVASAPASWAGFGWGIAHEIGHNINQGTYAVAEVTNNYFAQLLTGKTRYSYSNVYKKVTSGTIGRSSNVFTQLALYWQLHLAFDNNTDDRHIFDNYEDQFNNLFFARVDTYSRNPKAAPQEGLALNGGTDQNLMRLACAAANKNIIPFFERWGMVPDSATLEYAAKYGEPETKALYYVNDNARDYRVAHPSEDGSIKDSDAASAVVSSNSNQVEINITTDRDADLILGYEIVRTMTSNGQKSTKVIGFKPIDTAESTIYVDTITSINNRVMEYEVRAVDKYLNYSKTAYAGPVKIQTDGVLGKSEWTVETTMTSIDDTTVDMDEDDPDNGYDASNPSSVDKKTVHSIDRIIDNDLSQTGTYNGISENAASITIDMHRTEEVTSLKYVGDAIADVTVEISIDGNTWTTVKESDNSLNAAGEHMLWFDSVNEEERDSWIGTYDARYVRLTIPQPGSISISEIDVCGPSGDNLEFMTTEDNRPAIGVLQSDYKYGAQAEDVIPEGSLIFTGVYKGNPAYNVVVLYDSQGNVIGAKDDNVKSGQVIFADVPQNGNLGETSDGIWVYYVEPGQWDEDSIKQLEGVRAELYRVDNALTLEGERIVSDTQMIKVPENIPDITLTGAMSAE